LRGHSRAPSQRAKAHMPCLARNQVSISLKELLGMKKAWELSLVPPKWKVGMLAGSSSGASSRSTEGPPVDRRSSEADKYLFVYLHVSLKRMRVTFRRTASGICPEGRHLYQSDRLGIYILAWPCRSILIQPDAHELASASQRKMGITKSIEQCGRCLIIETRAGNQRCEHVFASSPKRRQLTTLHIQRWLML
jgi:hypothetical protein